MTLQTFKVDRQDYKDSKNEVQALLNLCEAPTVRWLLLICFALPTRPDHSRDLSAHLSIDWVKAMPVEELLGDA